MSGDPNASGWQYGAALLKKLISPLALTEPTADDFGRLSGKVLEIALAVLSEGRDKNARHARLKVEATARSMEKLIAEVDSADPYADLSAIQVASGWNAFDLADVISEELPPLRWLVKPFLPRPSVVAFFGKPKTMKSLLVLDMCLHIAGGQQWLASSPEGNDGLEVTPASVVWLDLENGAATLKRRMKAFARALGMSGLRGQFRAYSMPSPWPDLNQEQNATALVARIQSLGDVGVLVLDHLGQVFGAVDENSPLASQIMGRIREISEACNLAIVLIHHAKKGQGKDSGAPEDQLRGSGAIMAGIDGAYLVERDKMDKKQLRVVPVAVRGPEAPNLAATFSYEQDENLDLSQARFWRLAWRSNSAKAMDAVLKVLADGRKNQTQLVAAVRQIEPGVSDRAARDAIAALEGVHDIYYVTADKGAKMYELRGDHEDNAD